MPINHTTLSSPNLSRGQSAVSIPLEKNAHLLGEQEVDLFLKLLCLQQQLFNPFVWYMKSVPRTQGLLITVGHFPSLQINWQKPLVTSFWMHLLIRAGEVASSLKPVQFFTGLENRRAPTTPNLTQQIESARKPCPILHLPELAPLGLYLCFC